MAEWTPDPERHRPEGMDMAGRVSGVRRWPKVTDEMKVRDALDEAKREWKRTHRAGAPPHYLYDRGTEALNRLVAQVERVELYERVLRNLIEWADDRRGDDLGVREWTEAREALDA